MKALVFCFVLKQNSVHTMQNINISEDLALFDRSPNPLIETMREFCPSSCLLLGEVECRAEMETNWN